MISSTATPGAARRKAGNHLSAEETAQVTVQIQALFRHPGWECLQHYLRVRRRVAMEQLQRLDPGANAVEMARLQGEVRLIDRLATAEPEASSRAAAMLVDNLERV